MKYVGCGGDYDVRPRRNFTCLITTCCLMSLLLLIPLLLWLLWDGPTNECYIDQANWQYKWSKDKQTHCCTSVGIGCPLTQPRANPPGPVGPVDPFNCALGDQNW